MKTKVFNNGSFLLLWCARTISMLGDSLFEIGLTLLIYDRTGSTIAMGMNLIMFFVPSWIFGFIGGVVADRYNRKTVMVLSDILRGIILLFLPMFICPKAWPVAWVYIITFILSTLGQFYNPASGAIVPQVVDAGSLVMANSAINTAKQLVGIVGPALAGIIIGLHGITATIYANIFSFFISSFLIFFIHTMNSSVNIETKKGAHGFYTGIIDGVSYVAGRRDLKLLLMLMFIINAFLGPLNVILPVYADNTLGYEVTGYSMMLSGYSVGSLAGAASVGFIMRYAGYDVLIAAGIATIGIGLATLGMFANLYYAISVMAVVGIGSGILTVIASVMIQRTTPEDLLGRVLSTMGIIGTTTVPISIAVTGILLNYITSKTYFIICGLIVLVFLAWYVIHIRSFDINGKSVN